MIEQIIHTNKKVIPIFTNGVESEKILLYFHGLDGSAKESKNLFKNIKNFTVISVSLRGNENEKNLKASRSYKKYLKDIFDIIIFFKKQNKKIYLLGESGGGAFASLISYYFKDAVEYVFACAIPNILVNIFLEKKSKQFIINFRTFLTYFFNINYKFNSKIDFSKITNNKSIMRISTFKKNERYSQTRNIISTWTAIKKFWWNVKRKNPNSPIIYFFGSKDIMLNMKKLKKNIKKAKYRYENFDFVELPDSKHVILYEENSKIIYEKINEIMLKG